MQRSPAHFLGLIFILGLTSCGDSGPSGSSLVEQPLPESVQEFKIAESSAERFRYRTRETTATQARPAPAAAAPKLTYEIPDGWNEKPAARMRDVNLSFGEDGVGECYVTRLPGVGGGLVANVNRWRAQMGAEALTEEEIEALPKKSLLGQPAVFLSVDGEFSPGMGSQESFPDYRLLGLISSLETGAVFVKMTGPKTLVEANSEAFDAFVASLTVSTN